MLLRLKRLWPAKRERRILTYCFAHKPVVISRRRATLVELGPPGTVDAARFARKINAYEIVPDGAAHHPFLAGTLGSFAVLRDLKARGARDDALVNITHYRRFTLPEPKGKEEPEYPGMRILRRRRARQIDIHAALKAMPEPFLFSQPLTQPSIIEVYSISHHREDLERFAEAAVRAGVLTDGDIDQWFAERTLIPGGVEYGVSPVSVYVRLVEQLEATSRAFLSRYRPVDEESPYQIRALNFCNERLGSFLLQRELARYYRGLPPEAIFGHMHVVSEDGVYQIG